MTAAGPTPPPAAPTSPGPADPLAPVVVAGGQPTEEELAAVLAAIEVAWPRPVAPAAAAEPLSLRWRFSGRWWTRSVISRRDRPWVGPQR